MGHSNQEIDVEGFKDLRKEKIRKNVSHIFLPNGRRVILMAEVGGTGVRNAEWVWLKVLR